jgi:signal transduction histidine kinase
VVGLLLATDDLGPSEGYREPVSEPGAPTEPAQLVHALVARIVAIPPIATDLAVAGVVVLLTAAAATAHPHPEPIAGTLLLVAGAATLAVRRRWPIGVLIATLVPYVLTRHTGTGQPAVLVALYTVASSRPQRTAVIWALIAGAATIAAVTVHEDSATVAVGRVLAVVAAVLLGLAVAERRRRQEQDRVRAGEIAAANERVRIARELHDVVAHHLSVIVVQANLVGDTLTPDEPAFAPAQAIIAAGREALADMRRVLGVLRTREEPEGLAPQPGLGELDQLLTRVRATGLDVDLTVEGNAGNLPTGLDLSAYRIVQEALTNVVRHARASHAAVNVRYSVGSLVLEITDDGVGPGRRASAPPNGSAPAGHGIDGMRERAALFGGTLDVGPNPGRGFRVRAELPV